MTLTWIRQLLPIAAGAAAGIVGSYLFSTRAVMHRPTHPVASAELRPLRTAEPRVAPVVTLAPAATARELRQAEAVGGKPAAAPPPDPERLRREVEERFARDLQAHAHDARDPSWATRAEQSLGEALRAGEGKPELVDIQCRTSTCVATLAWPSPDQAQHGYRDLLVADYKPNCTTRIVLPEARDQDARYEARLFFDCANARAED